jgi:hypothetical protein
LFKLTWWFVLHLSLLCILWLENLVEKTMNCSSEYKKKRKKKRWKLLPCKNFGWYVVTFTEDESNRWALGTKVFSLGVLLHNFFKPYYHKKSNTTLWKKIMFLTYKKDLNINKLQEHVSCASRDWKIIYQKDQTSWKSCNF